MNINHVIEALNNSESLRNFTVLSDQSLTISAEGIEIVALSASYLITEYSRDNSTGEYTVLNSYSLTLEEVLDQIEDWDATLS